jgi:putative glutamine amidotransferase
VPLRRTGPAPVAVRRRARPRLGPTDVELDRAELSLARAALDRGLPVLGICRGHELLNVLYGGTLHQDVPGHRQTEPGVQATHDVRLEPGSRLAGILGATEGRVNSFHHQAVDALGRGLRAVAWSPDGIVEGIEDPAAPWVLGVQWHAEGLIGAPDQEALFTAFVAEAAGGLDRAANAA